eukprot:2782996-Karenia_brevis.AAC.1
MRAVNRKKVIKRHGKVKTPASTDTVTLEWIDDSGAGRVVFSDRAFKEQGVQPKLFRKHLSKSRKPMIFETGGGE